MWLGAQELWSRFKAGRDKLTEKDPHGTTITRDRWIGPLLTDPVRLSYDLHYQPSAVVLEGLTFAISIGQVNLLTALLSTLKAAQ